MMRSSLSLAALLLCANFYSYSQTFQAQVTGSITDSSGAAVPDAVITAKDLGTGAVVTTKSNGTGDYTLPYLKPSEYQIKCEVPGFKRFEQGPITLQVNQVLQINVRLEPGTVNENVTVSAEAAPLQTESASLAQVVTTRSIEGLPLNVRDPFGLVALTPGAVMGSNFGVGGGTSDFGRVWYNSDYYIGGGSSGSQEVMLDGAPIRGRRFQQGRDEPAARFGTGVFRSGHQLQRAIRPEFGGRR